VCDLLLLLLLLQGELHTASADVNEVFGGTKKFRLDWLLPTKPVFPAHCWEEVMGYRLPADYSESEPALTASTTLIAPKELSFYQPVSNGLVSTSLQHFIALPVLLVLFACVLNCTCSSH
jgi:hypothetical protein